MYAHPYMKQAKDGQYQFADDEAVKKFISEVMLKGVRPSQRENAIKFLEANFHQGGIMYPVSAPLADSMPQIKVK